MKWNYLVPFMQKDEKEEVAPELDAVVETIHSPEQLFAVLNEQLTMVQDLSDKIRDKRIALQHSEEARQVIRWKPETESLQGFGIPDP